MVRGLFCKKKHYTKHSNRHKETSALEIKALTTGMKRVEVEATIVDKGNARQVQSRFGNETFNVADAIIQDETGTIKLTLWNEQIDQVKVGDRIKIENGYVTSFKSETQLNVGKYGKLTIL
jgi:replication factor A1